MGFKNQYILNISKYKLINKKMKKQIGLDNKSEIITLNNHNKTIKEISQITGVPKSTIQDIIKKFKNNKTLDRVRVSGRKKSLNKKEINFILNEI